MAENDQGAIESAGPKTRTERARPEVPFYPNALKYHYIDLLRRWKDERARVTGKPVGWLTIRDMIMEPEDAKLTEAEQAIRRKRNAREARRIQAERDGFLTVDHLKAWDRGAALPGDPRCYFIERFLNRLRRDGQMGAVEQAATAARQKYIKDALFALYRLDRGLNAGGRLDLLAQACGFSNFAGTGFLIEGAAVDQSLNSIDLILRIGEVDRLIFDVEILLVRRPSVANRDQTRTLVVKDVNRDQIRLLYHGALVPFEYPIPDMRVSRVSDGAYQSRWALLASNAVDVIGADLGINGGVPKFLQCGIHLGCDKGTVSMTFMAGGQLEWLSGMVSVRPESRLQPTVVEVRFAVPVSWDVAAALSNRDFARALFA